MKIFKSLNDSPCKTGQFIGFHVEEDMDVLLTLLAINRGISKSALLRGVLNEMLESKQWLMEDKHGLSIIPIIALLAKKAYMIWELNWSGRCSISEFKKNIQQDLCKKRVSMSMIHEIVQEFDVLVSKKSGEQIISFLGRSSIP